MTISYDFYEMISLTTFYTFLLLPASSSPIFMSLLAIYFLSYIHLMHPVYFTTTRQNRGLDVCFISSIPVETPIEDLFGVHNSKITTVS